MSLIILLHKSPTVSQYRNVINSLHYKPAAGEQLKQHVNDTYSGPFENEEIWQTVDTVGRIGATTTHRPTFLLCLKLAFLRIIIICTHATFAVDRPGCICKLLLFQCKADAKQLTQRTSTCKMEMQLTAESGEC